jgi:integrase
MAVTDRWHLSRGPQPVCREHGLTPSQQHGRGDRWQARWRDEAGAQRKQNFSRKIDAERHLAGVKVDLLRGVYVDPSAGKLTFRAYAERWRSGQVHRATTRAYVETMLRRHAFPVLGGRALSSVRPSDVQAWVKGMTDSLAASTVGIVHGVASGIFRAAVRDRLIVSNPCEGTRLPKVTKARVEPLPIETVRAIGRALPARYRALVTLAAGTGMRQGECLGLTVDRVDFLRRTVTVNRQLVTVPGREPFLAPPKTSASVRAIPLPQIVLDALAAHLAAFPTDELVFVNERGHPIRRTAFGSRWRAAVVTAGAPSGTGFHDLRHFYASLLIRHGESVKVVQARLGHASASETLDTYSHLWPDSEDRTRTAVDEAFSSAASALDVPSEAH